MVRAERGALVGGSEVDDILLRRRQMRWAFVMAVCAVAAAGGVLAALGGGERVELEFPAKRKLTGQEKTFVKTTTSTPDKSLEKDAKFASKDGAKDMDAFYDKMGSKLGQVDAVAKKHIAVMHAKASTAAAKRDITHYFDRMRGAVEAINAAEHKKQAGTGKASLKDINSYFDGLSAKQAAVNHKDQLELAGASHVAAKPQAAPQNPLAPVQGEIPKDAESTSAARDDINSYFDSLQSAQSSINSGDTARLAGKGKKAAAPVVGDKRLTAQQSLDDLGKYYDSLTASVRPKDASDVARLRKDSSPANAHDGVRVAKEAVAGARVKQLKAYKAQKRQREAGGK
mmetsp:Transcript_17989/g.41605  ORF Transcript_17989/g.41605 Transcript_17989/m.41605 type:complete len:342 (+) Transcript_17989:20-1045(+)